MSEPEKKSPSVLGVIIKGGVVCVLVGILLVIVIANLPCDCTSPANACINNLFQIDSAKNYWALVNSKTNGVVAESDITPYIKLDTNGNLPKCPSGGTYTIGKIGEPPTCSLGTTVNPPHVLP